MQIWTTERLAALASTVFLALAGSPADAAAQMAEPALPSGPTPAAIRADDFRTHVEVIAHDSMRGRDTPSPGLRKTAEYVAGRFRAFGLRPGLGEEGYQQYYPLTSVRPGSPGRQRVRLQGPDGATRLDSGDDFVAAPTARRASADGPLATWDPDAGGSPPAPGVLLVEVTPENITGVLPRVRDALRRDGAGGALMVVDAPDAYFDRLRSFFDSEQTSVGEPDALSRPVVLMQRTALPEALASALEEGRPVSDDWTVELETRARVTGGRAMNTIGWIRGSDPELRDEYVVFTAHMDHLGVGRPADGDSIYNGADDDASGVAAILELAQAFASVETKPRRSLVFMTVSGEEKGLLGSRWYTEHPVFSLDRTVAAVNLDMIGRNWPDTVAAIGKEMSSLGETVDAVAAEHPELGLEVVEDQWPERRFYYRSDHYNFARRGVPVLFFFSGVHEDYHAPSDEIGDLDLEKTARITRLIYLLGRDVADSPEPPEWDPNAYEKVVEEGRNR